MSGAAGRKPSKKVWLLIIVVLIGALWVGFRTWQGPAVEVYVVKPTDLTQTVVATGRVATPSRSQIGSEITGVVERRLVREGDKVQAGDLLIELKSDELAARVREAQASLSNLRLSRRPQAAATLAQVEAQLQQASREAQRRAALLESDSISREVYEKAQQAQTVAMAAAQQARLLSQALATGGTEEQILQARLTAAQAALAKTQIRAQVDGTVLTRNVEPGDLVQAGRVLLEVARTDDTEILVPVDERNLGVLMLDQTAQAIPDAYPARVFEAIVNHLAPTVDPLRGTVDVRLTVSDPPDYLKQDMTVTVTILTGQVEQGWVIPNDALRNVEGNQATIAILSVGRVSERLVTLGLRGLQATQITDGLENGDRVILTPGLQVGQRVRADHVD
jgi:HlyD family secretion protein